MAPPCHTDAVHHRTLWGVRQPRGGSTAAKVLYDDASLQRPSCIYDRKEREVGERTTKKFNLLHFGTILAWLTPSPRKPYG